jgi:hypothetical protein
MLKRLFNSYIKRRLFLAYRKQKRFVNIVTLQEAKTVGILWNPLDEESLESYESLRKLLSDRRIKSFGIAYIVSKREKETMATVSHSWLISSNNVSFLGRPRSGDGVSFIQQEFDILIDLSILKCIPLQYLLIHSSAKFKIGWQAADPNVYDLEIDVTSQPRSRFLMEQIVYYLDKLNDNK